MKKITQQNPLLSVIENIIRSNIYLFIFFRYLANKFFATIIYETDFKILFFLRNSSFLKKKLIVDIGANDGISIKIIRKFVKNKIASFEPNIQNYKKIKLLKKKDSSIVAYNLGLSNIEANKVPIFGAFFNGYHLSPFDSLLKTNVIKHLKESLFIKDIVNKVVIKKSIIKITKLDTFKFKPCFIKIDIQGHEFECIEGAIKTIKKSKPIIMVEYDPIIINRIYKVLKVLGYKKFYFLSNKEKLFEHKKEKVFNIFFIHNSLLNEINKTLKITKLDNNKT